MRIGVDLDGTVYEFHRTAAYMLREYRKLYIPPVHEFWHTWDGLTEYASPADLAWLWTEGVRLGLFRYGHMITGARIALQEIHARGHELVIITHRPHVAVDDTNDWLDLFFKDIPLAGRYILSNGQPKTSVEADLLIDDKGENVRLYAEAGRGAILFWRPWSETDGAWTGAKAGSWKGVLKCLPT